MYNVHRMVYETALKDIYLDPTLGETVLGRLLPELITYKSMLHIRDIDDRKAADAVKKQKKKEERAALGLSEEEEEELKLDIPQPTAKKGTKKKVEIDPEVIEKARQEALFKRELATYGVSSRLLLTWLLVNGREPGSGKVTLRTTRTGGRRGLPGQLVCAKSTLRS